MSFNDSDMIYTPYSQKYKETRKKCNENFVEWIDKVEHIVIKKLHMSLLGLPDNLYMVNFEKGMPAKQMADIVIKDYLNMF